VKENERRTSLLLKDVGGKNVKSNVQVDRRSLWKKNRKGQKVLKKDQNSFLKETRKTLTMEEREERRKKQFGLDPTPTKPTCSLYRKAMGQRIAEV